MEEPCREFLVKGKDPETGKYLATTSLRYRHFQELCKDFVGDESYGRFINIKAKESNRRPPEETEEIQEETSDVHNLLIALVRNALVKTYGRTPRKAELNAAFKQLLNFENAPFLKYIDLASLEQATNRLNDELYDKAAEEVDDEINRGLIDEVMRDDTIMERAIAIADNLSNESKHLFKVALIVAIVKDDKEMINFLKDYLDLFEGEEINKLIDIALAYKNYEILDIIDGWSGIEDPLYFKKQILVGAMKRSDATTFKRYSFAPDEFREYLKDVLMKAIKQRKYRFVRMLREAGVSELDEE